MTSVKFKVSSGSFSHSYSSFIELCPKVDDAKGDLTIDQQAKVMTK